jgi:membrane protein YdbS with pleckstrin-like domain
MNMLLKRTYLTSGLLFLGLIISVAAANSIIFFAKPGSRLVYSELIVTAAAAAIIAVVGILLAYRQVIYDRSHSKSYISMAVGLVF